MRFTPDHEWVRLDDGIATIGITAHAAAALGDIVYLEICAPGTELARGDVLGIVESVKAASEIYAPIAGTVTLANARAIAEPGLIGQAPTMAGWLACLRPRDPADVERLLDDAAYRALLDLAGDDR